MVAFTRLATFRIPSCTTSLVVARGSVVDFAYSPNPQRSGIVNAANQGCLGGGGVDGAISDAGGETLLQDRLALPTVGGGIRCPTGQAKITGPNEYGSLNVPHVIHAVGPSYFDYPSFEEPDKLLTSAYTNSLIRATEAKLEGVAFSLLSAGIFRGERKVKEVLQIGMQAICDYHASNKSTLQEVYMCAFNDKEARTLCEIAKELELELVEPHEESSSEESDVEPQEAAAEAEVEPQQETAAEAEVEPAQQEEAAEAEVELQQETAPKKTPLVAEDDPDL